MKRSQKASSSLSSSEDSDSSDIGEDDPSYIKGYKCSICSAFFSLTSKYKAHTSLKTSTCVRCKQIFFCNSQMKDHYDECLKERVRKKNYTEKRPPPRYIRGIDEHIKRRDMVLKESCTKPEMPKKPE
jgi:DNA-directed RNA polymerase subunit RPC12/RpoP